MTPIDGATQAALSAATHVSIDHGAAPGAMDALDHALQQLDAQLDDVGAAIGEADTRLQPVMVMALPEPGDAVATAGLTPVARTPLHERVTSVEGAADRARRLAAALRAVTDRVAL